MISAVNGVLLKALPYPESDHLVQVWETDARFERTRGSVSPLNLDDWRTQSMGLATLALGGPMETLDHWAPTV